MSAPGETHGAAGAANGAANGAGHAAGDGAPFTGQLRARPETIVLGGADATERWTVRVQSAEAWDAVRFSAPPSEPVLALKTRALQALTPGVAGPDAFVLKLNGAEVLDESASLAAAGALDGSIFLLAHRRRRPVR